MERYEPPFTITNRMLGLTAGIAEKVGKITGLRSYETRPYLRRNNRIRSVHSSLAIEANSLSLDEVRSVINGQPVVGPEKEIREVRNAYAAYEMLGSFDPFSLDDLKKLHAVMMDLTVNDAGSFRTHNEGVFNGDKCIFIAPPPQLVPEQMEALFTWMNKERDTLHPLILSSVFHYEFVFIHPFSDGNGRMARLLADGIRAKAAADPSKGYEFIAPFETNMIFILVPKEMVPQLAEKAAFETYPVVTDTHQGIRLVTSWATTEEEVNAFLDLL